VYAIVEERRSLSVGHMVKSLGGQPNSPSMAKHKGPVHNLGSPFPPLRKHSFESLERYQLDSNITFLCRTSASFGIQFDDSIAKAGLAMFEHPIGP